jgi:hypothetical protein
MHAKLLASSSAALHAAVAAPSITAQSTAVAWSSHAACGMMTPRAASRVDD